MSVWMTMFRKDVRSFSTGWLWGLSIIVVITVAVGASSYFGFIPPGVSIMLGVVLTMLNVFVLPVYLFRGLRKDMKGTPSLWLQTPLSGWAMLSSKLLSSLVGAVIFIVVSYALSLALFHVDAANILAIFHKHPPQIGYSFSNNLNHGQNFSNNLSHANTLTLEQSRIIDVVISQIPRLEFYLMVGLLSCGLYIAMWVSLIYISVRAVRNRLHKFSWLVALGLVLVATWGLGAVQDTALYQQIFGWGPVSVLALFPTNVQSLISNPSDAAAIVTLGHVVFHAIITVLLFYLTGRMIDRHVEI